MTSLTPLARGYATFFRGIFALCACVCCAVFVHAQTAKQNFNIPAGDAKVALKAFAEQSHAELLASDKAIAGVKTKAVSGEMTPSEALNLMLADTGLVADYNSKSNAVAVRRETAVESKNVNRAIADSSARPNEKTDAVRSEDGAVKLATFEVFGRKTLNMDMTRSRDDALPYVTFDRADIVGSGALTVSDFFARRLTSNMNLIRPETVDPISGSNNTLSLRGLTATENLILVDGRPLGNQFNYNGFPTQPNLNAIPVGAIQKIEILPASGSGIYGGGALGGVVNIILRRDYVGAEVRLIYGNTFHSDVANRRAELNGGLSLEGGRTSVTFSAGWADGGELQQQDRDFRNDAYSIILKNNPAAIGAATSSLSPLGATTNVHSFTGNLTFKTGGTVVPSPNSSVPYGYSGPTSDNGVAFANRAGIYNLDMVRSAASSAGAYAPLWTVADQERYATTIRREMNSWLDMFFEGSYSTETRPYRVAPTSAFAMLATNTGNPFNNLIFVNTPILGLDTFRTLDLENARFAIGATARLPRGWNAEFDNTWDINTTSMVLPATQLLPTFQAAVQSGAIDIFRDLNQFPVNLSSYRAPDGGVERYTTTSQLWSARASGPLPGVGFLGDSTLSILAQYRRDDLPDTHQSFYVGQILQQQLTPARWQAASSVAAEVVVPIVAETRPRFLLNSLTFDLASRYDQYRTKAPTGTVPTDANGNPTQPVIPGSVTTLDSFNPSIGILYGPTKDLKIRGSFGTGFLPPSVQQLAPAVRQDYGSPQTQFQQLKDPLRGNEPVTYTTYFQGGNPNLKPEESKTWTAGLIFSPSAMKGLRLSIDWVNIKKHEQIEGALIQSATDQKKFETVLAGHPERFGRGAPSGGFSVGPIVTIDNSAINISRREIQAVDFALDYSWSTTVGKWLLSSKATRDIARAYQLLPGFPFTEEVGVFFPKFKANVSASWQRGDWSATWSVRYYGDYYLNTSHTVDLSLGTDKISSQIYHDFVVSYIPTKLSNRFLKGTEFTVALSNVFDREPPIASTFPYYPSGSGDGPLLARYSVSVAKRF